MRGGSPRTSAGGTDERSHIGPIIGGSHLRGGIRAETLAAIPMATAHGSTERSDIPLFAGAG